MYVRTLETKMRFINNLIMFNRNEKF